MYFDRSKATENYSKKKSPFYKERDELKRSIFVKKLTHYAPDKLVYIDESGIDKFISRELWMGFDGA